MRKRLTAEGLLAEPWVKGLTSSAAPLPQAHRDALAAFQEGRRVWRAAIDAAALFLGSPNTALGVVQATCGGASSGTGATAAPLPASAEEELRRAYAVYDKDGNGAIDLEELREVMASLHIGGIGANAAEVMRAIDVDGSGGIDFEEFKRVMRPLYDSSGAALRRIFSVFDADGSGFIDSKELSVMLQKLGLGKDACTKEALERVFAAADLDHNGKVDFLEFAGLFAKSAALGVGTTSSTPGVAA